MGTGRVVKASTEAKVALSERTPSGSYSPAAPLEIFPHQIRHAGSFGPHPNR
jgi:hypothetical protein